MQQTHAFVEALKTCLRAKGLTYRDLAETLDLSETSVKRLFAEQTFTLKKVELILDRLELTLAEVATLAAKPNRPNVLTVEQEEVLSVDERLFSVFHLLLFGLDTQAILAGYEISAEELAGHYRMLESLALGERQPGDRIKLLTSRTVGWIDDGPLRQRYGRRLIGDFLDAGFDEPGATRQFMSRTLSEASRAVIGRKVAQLFAEIDSMSQADVAHESEGVEPTGVFLAVRRFEFRRISALTRR